MSHNSSTLADRMKQYEEASRFTLPRRLPVIVRVDGRAFSKLTSKLSKPFDDRFVSTMDEVARTLCEEIQGAQLAYVQSDEVSVLVHGYKSYESSPWFDNQVQKMVSVAAAIAASTFTFNSQSTFGNHRQVSFDARTFVLPEVEVSNYFEWRQQDATRNSVQMSARARFSHRECENKSCEQMKEMLLAVGDDWEQLPDGLKRGRVVLRRPQKHFVEPSGSHAGFFVERNAWTIEPAFRFAQQRSFVESLLATEDR